MPTMRMRFAAAPLVAALAFVGVGCGGSSSSSKQSAAGGPSGAEVIPAGAPAYVAVNTDLGSAQWKQVDALSKTFPGRAKVIAQIQQQLMKSGVDFKTDVKPALGPEIAWRPQFIELTRLFEHEWYGSDESNSDALDECSAAARQILQAVRRVNREAA